MSSPLRTGRRTHKSFSVSPVLPQKNAFLLLLTCCTHFYGHAQVQQRGTVRVKKSVHVAETQSFRTKREIYLINPFLLSSLSFLYSSLLGTTISNQSTRGGEKEVGCISLKVRRGGGLLLSLPLRLTSILVLSGLKKEREKEPYFP